MQSNIFSAVVVVTRSEDLQETTKVLSEYFPSESVLKKIIVGSSERTKSFIQGFSYFLQSNDIKQDSVIALFDANRPFTSLTQITSLHGAAIESGCSCPARPVVNGVAKTEDNRIIEVPDKSSFSEFVTPEFLAANFFNNLTVDFLEGYNCFVEFALENGCRPATVPASTLNSKLTYPEDKVYLEGLALDYCLHRPTKLAKSD